MMLQLVDRWATRSQQGSRRNAMVATTELTRRRMEHDEVESWLATRLPRRTPEPDVRVGASAATR